MTMATWNDVSRLALELPEVEEITGGDGQLSWKVKGKLFVWERPLRKRDIDELGDAAPAGPILVARTDGEAEKFALVQIDPDVYFTTSHFNGYPAVLVRLDRIKKPALGELVIGAWLIQAPKTLVKQFRAGTSAGS
jgi:hypothetical protein